MGSESFCSGCGACTDACVFLKKYGLTIADFSGHPELAYHCFLCGACEEVCADGLSGKKVAMKMRREHPSTKGYGALLWEKQNYKYRSRYPIRSRTVLFPGCNFPSFYPKTNASLVRLLWEKAGIDVLYDCCGKPIYELGLDTQENSARFGERLKQSRIEELIVVCPNCYAYLRQNANARIVPVYDKLWELGIRGQCEAAFRLFLPCPEREESAMLAGMEQFFSGGFPETEEIQCCGLGGGAGVFEPELASGFARAPGRSELPLMTYCASCAGNLARKGAGQIHHALADILGTGESPVTSAWTVWNRARHVVTR